MSILLFPGIDTSAITMEHAPVHGAGFMLVTFLSGKEDIMNVPFTTDLQKQKTPRAAIFRPSA